MLPPIVDFWFQFLFHSPPGVLFTFPSRYSFTIGHQVVFSFTQWSGQIPTEFHVLHGTWVHNYQTAIQFRLQDFHPLRLSFPKTFIYCIRPTQHLCLLPIMSHFPYTATRTRLHSTSFIAFSVSLTTTQEINFVFFSWHYLDVSVHAVRFLTLYIQVRMISLQLIGFPHSEISGS